MKNNSFKLLSVFALSLLAICGCQKEPTKTPTMQPQTDEAKTASSPVAEAVSKPKTETISLFDGETLEEWETIEFGGEGETSITADSAIRFEMGVTMTGISSTLEDLPKTNYDISLEARKTDGTDFFCGLTFPVAESFCTLIVGGWGGATVGLSCINDQDAGTNASSTVMKFEANQWYKIRVRVVPEKITVWIDDEQVIEEDIAGKKVSLRGDTDLCRPIGICSFMTAAEYKNISLEKLAGSDKADSEEADSGDAKDPAASK